MCVCAACLEKLVVIPEGNTERVTDPYSFALLTAAQNLLRLNSLNLFEWDSRVQGLFAEGNLQAGPAWCFGDSTQITGYEFLRPNGSNR